MPVRCGANADRSKRKTSGSNLDADLGSRSNADDRLSEYAGQAKASMSIAVIAESAARRVRPSIQTGSPIPGRPPFSL